MLYNMSSAEKATTYSHLLRERAEVLAAGDQLAASEVQVTIDAFIAANGGRAPRYRRVRR